MADTDQLRKETFRRNSLTAAGGNEVIEAEKIATIFGLIGQPFDSKKLQAEIAKLDPKGTGLLSQDNYDKIFKEFVTCPAAIAKYAGDEFAYKHLIKPSDFVKP